MASISSEQQLRFRWNDHMQHVSKVLTLQRMEEQFCDVTLVSEDGFVMKAHQAILASTSTYFQRVLSEVTSDQHPMIVLRGANFREISCLLDYMYQGNTQVDHSLMEKVLEVADMLEIKGLSRIRSNASIKKFMGPGPSPNSTNTASLNMPCTDNMRGSSRSPEEQFYRGNQPDTEGAQARLVGNVCDIRSSRETPHLPPDGPPMSRTQPHASHHESDPQDNEDVTQTSGIDLSMAKNEPWSPREGEAAAPASQKDDSEDDELSLSKKKRKHQENLCFEETVDPVSDPDWGRIGTKFEESSRQNPRTISLTSITTADTGLLSGLSDSEEQSDDNATGYIRAVVHGATRPFSTPLILPANKQPTASDSPNTRLIRHPLSASSLISLKTSPSSSLVYPILSSTKISSSSSSFYPTLSSSKTTTSSYVPSSSVAAPNGHTPKFIKYPRSQSCIPFSSSDFTPIASQNTNLKSVPQNVPTTSSLKTMLVDEQNAINASDKSLTEGNIPHPLAPVVKKSSGGGKKSSSVPLKSIPDTKATHESPQDIHRSKLPSSECLTPSTTANSEERFVCASSASTSLKKVFPLPPCTADPDKIHVLKRKRQRRMSVSKKNPAKRERQTVNTSLDTESLETKNDSQTNYVNIQLKEGKFENRYPVVDGVMPSEGQTQATMDNVKDEVVQKPSEPLCPLEKKIKRPRSHIKRPMNQYLLFHREMRGEMRAKYPDESNRKIAARLGYLWKNLPSSEKAMWQARAQFVKEEHKRLYPEYHYNPHEASMKRQEYISTLTERRNLYRVKPENSEEQN
ncbi:uncharacterized protein LOC121857198 isoform X2 [Homarus americanus]|uniref:uncharacterized protein LOC121857198 isoform X2 n=1 Tax=Homarus americanus TaxID=6706 RepID=UPI001C485723|nr:uncharacterized protein LOC121857198 isoform X2 [Homarus americanus]